jgi:Domain of unknown function (DUF4386)
MNYRRVATFTGWLWITTFVTSIPARLFFYAPVLEEEGNYVTGAGTDAQTLIAIGAVLELLLIISNVGTAVVPYPIHQRVHEAGAVAYVTARLVECTFHRDRHRLHARHLQPPPGRAQRDRRRARAGHLRGL